MLTKLVVMKILIPLLLFMVFCSKSFAEKKINLESIGFGKLLHISTQIELPKGQKLNQDAPSKIGVFEKEGSKWNLTEEIDLNSFFSLTELINFQRPVQLKSEKADIKIEASLYHCPRLRRGICVIDDYVGFIKRTKNKASSQVKISLVGTDPK